MGRPFMRILVLFHSTVLIPTGSRYMSSIPHCCADNLTYASNPSHHILTPQNEFICFLFFLIYFYSYAFFKNFSIVKWRYMGSGSKAAVFLNWADLSSMLSSHHICAEDFFSPHSIEDCFGPQSWFEHSDKGNNHLPCLQLNTSCPAHN